MNRETSKSCIQKFASYTIKVNSTQKKHSTCIKMKHGNKHSTEDIKNTSLKNVKVMDVVVSKNRTEFHAAFSPTVKLPPHKAM